MAGGNIGGSMSESLKYILQTEMMFNAEQFTYLQFSETKRNVIIMKFKKKKVNSWAITIILLEKPMC